MRIRSRAAVIACCAVALAAPAAPAFAKPSPQDRLERLTGRYDGLRDRLDEATKAASIAKATARTQRAALTAAQRLAGRTAAADYMAGGMDPSLAFAAANDPRAVLDQASAVRFFTWRNQTQVRGLTMAVQAAERASASAAQRVSEVRALTRQVTAQRKKVRKLVAATGAKVAKAVPGGPIPNVPGSSVGAAAVRAALSKLGRPYVWGGAGPNQFDCSGLTMWAYRQTGIGLPHYTTSQYAQGTPVSRAQLRPGDLVFFYSDMRHVGMYIGNGNVVHAPHTGDVVRIAPLSAMPYDGAVRIG